MRASTVREVATGVRWATPAICAAALSTSAKVGRAVSVCAVIVCGCDDRMGWRDRDGPGRRQRHHIEISISTWAFALNHRLDGDIAANSSVKTARDPTDALVILFLKS